jgi:hypothetical protein
MKGEDGTTSQYGEKKGKQVAYAIATQQAHKLGKTPKKKGGYGTVTGRVTAKKKFDQPKKEYKKTAASKIVRRMSGLLKCRQGRRPVRAETLLKKASQSGADLRIPLMGGTKFPTNDSLSQSRKTLKEHQNVGKPRMVQPVVQPVTGVNTMPKLGSEYASDPLVQYLKKVAQQTKVDSEGKVPDDSGDMITGPGDKELASHSAEPQRGDKTRDEWRSALEKMFATHGGITGKYLDHHHSYKEGVVPRELKSHGASGV